MRRSRRPRRRCAARTCGTRSSVTSGRARRRSGPRRRSSRRSVAATRPTEKSTTSATMRFPGLEQDDRAPGPCRVDRDRGDRLAEAESDVAIAHLVHQLVDDLAVEELERPLALLDDRDLDARAPRTSRRTRSRSRRAPTTAIVFGKGLQATMASLVRTIWPSTGTPGGAAGNVPTAIRMNSAV